MRCRACDTVWLVSGPSAEALPHETPPSSQYMHESHTPNHGMMNQPIQAVTGGHAAVVRRGTEREKRDLFATRPPDLGSVKQTLLPPPSVSPHSQASNGVAARNENSVLFTVNALAGAARVKTPEPSPAQHHHSGYSSPPPPYGHGGQGMMTNGVRPLSEDDEGIIDLKALSTAPPKPNRPEVAPLFPTDPPPGAFARDASGDPSPRRSGGKIAMFAAAAVVLVLSGVGLAVAFRGEQPVPRAATTAAPAPLPPPVATTAAPPTDPPPAAASASSASASNEEPKDAKPKKKKGKHHAGGGGTGAGTHAKADPPAPKVKPADPCGCKGDFNCILACTAKNGK